MYHLTATRGHLNQRQTGGQFYASATKIHKYFSDFAKKYNLNKDITLKSRVSKAIWNASTAEWEVQVTNTRTGAIANDKAHILVNAGGILNARRYPPIKGIEIYQGTLTHSAAWDPTIVLDGKTVGLIGNGSSGIQILPTIKHKVKHLITFIREATWISPPVGQEYKVYTPDERTRFAQDKVYHLERRREIESSMNGSFAMFHKGSGLQEATRAHMLDQMQSKVQNAELAKVLIPELSVGCRRLTPGTNYLESLSAKNVQVVHGEIDEITEKGCWVAGKEYPVDMLICATGFDTTFKPRFPLVGSTGQRLDDSWKDEPTAYFGIAAANYPNYFMTLGSNCPIGNGPALISIEAEVDYMVKMLLRFQKENIRSFDIEPDSVQQSNEWKDEFMSQTIWTEECRSCYKSGNIHGKVAALWPGSTLHYLEAMAQPKWEDWNWAHQPGGNRFEYLGNSRSSAETRPGGNLSHYIWNRDDTEIETVLKNPVKGEDVGKEGLLKPKL